MLQNILVVCLDNTCRSPIAERLSQKRLSRHQISSVGLKAFTDNDIDFQVVKAALKHGVVVTKHTARQLTAEMCERADLILVMEPEQIDMATDVHLPVRSRTILFV